MSNGDFEVMPIGTIAEVKAVRKISNELIELVDRDADLEEIVDKINEYTKDGWELMSVTSGVQSPSEKGSQGIYMTRYLFRKGMN